MGGALGSYALVGVLVGALLAGTIADMIGRRKVMLLAYAWFSVGMAVTALMTTTTGFGLMRFVTGLGVGALVATTGRDRLGVRTAREEEPLQRHHLLRRALREPAGRAAGHHPARRDRLAGHVLDRRAADRHVAAAGVLQDARVAGLAALPRPGRGGPRDRRADRRAAGRGAARSPRRRAAKRERVGFAGLFSGGNAFPTILLGFMSVTGLVLVYALNTWLPELMSRAGFSTKGSLSFLLVLNGGAILGALVGSRFADRFGPKPWSRAAS